MTEPISGQDLDWIRRTLTPPLTVEAIANGHTMARALLAEVDRLTAAPHQLADKARRALDALDDLIYNCEDPGTEALGARYELAQELLRHPDPEAPVDGPNAAAIALLRDRIAAEFAREDAEVWGYDHGFADKYGTHPVTDSFVDIAVTAFLGSALYNKET